MSTPARVHAACGADGLRWLSDDAAFYADGGEDYVTAVLECATDRAQLSDELALAARTWPERYHLERGRANLLRALTVSPAATVLEVGAGCGAITSYLAQDGRTVDAMEPNATRARAARARTDGCGDVAVFVGGVHELPAEPVYDLVVVVGVLEYVGAGSADDEAYVAFLRALRRRLRGDGALVLAIENRLGVKYLSGAPEDHTGRAWDGLDGYPHDGAARTFSRAHLSGLLRAAGFDSARMLGAFPDYKLTDAVVTDELLTGFGRLATNLPRFPSPDWSGSGVRVVREQVLWRELVAEGIAGSHENSLLVLAGNHDAPASLWPQGRLGSFFHTDRARAFCTEGHIERRGSSVSVCRRPITPSSAHGVAVTAVEEPYHDLPVALDEIVAAPRRAGEVLRRWRELVEHAAPRLGARLWGLVPAHVARGPHGLASFGLEWTVEWCSVDDVLGRGILLTADRVAVSSRPDGRTVGDVVTALAAAAGIDDFRMAHTIAREAEFQAIEHTGAADPATLRAASARFRAQWDKRLSQPLGEC